MNLKSYKGFKIRIMALHNKTLDLTSAHLLLRMDRIGLLGIILSISLLNLLRWFQSHLNELNFIHGKRHHFE